MSSNTSDEQRIFEKSFATNGHFWKRIGQKPNFYGKRVLDAGCGHGALAIDAALSGARSVVAIDFRKESVCFARSVLHARFPHLQATVEFLEADITKFHCKEPFDIIISRDSFEHFARPQETLQVMTTSLKNGGRMYVGFSPLYYSPIGHHFEFGFLPPWGHCVIPEAVLCVLAARRTRGPKPVSVADVGLNKWTPKRFRTLFNTSRLRIVDYQINRSENSLAKLFSFFAWFPGVERFFTLGIYCVLEKP
ncbi:MAG: hypothetical protein A2268_02145 [Candidatus Raymondbacteria bacterium RifOxyA12_full_50_37]|uniref:Methyltransferase domain-containing protein n=1 Tax=Candidatus Raymondbacteria bacterium RIFOXYD12_FULL_49_13 TaxID=1817890 RepID=A0A1F7F4Z6_UNCRA|nr:MAG: hypothetical protein A2268_02145 [Candidatus Raymondbacteria bacterium RifOxyA12_full_50_37]OGJ91317.1 MAG: hypothetical protein A2350_13190 [Candidatus Raymondbacteria bacterium RifOxyB12_full_50_8]OGJ92257.1 MAG: hypothetical protein A2248_10975 [Candidatus Raymondbacteria bacterium RIFOXYA2_FULL_49_16]OGJ98583.1 MAG: hypothetical protein A2453_06775 [Candidatus Raymondbacteria bacterium RIFOXYC2_FULL_50_21]OGK01607.1 MAG: hypothetical protein A2519_05955 [Candidatus Raymondbacteria b